MREEEDVKAVRSFPPHSSFALAECPIPIPQFLGKAIDPPKVEQMDSAWRTLMDLGAVEGEHATSKLTALGRHVSLTSSSSSTRASLTSIPFL